MVKKPRKRPPLQELGTDRQSAMPAAPEQGDHGVGNPVGNPVDEQEPVSWRLDAVTASATLILVLALGLRVAGLGVQPLQPGEAANAWETWSMVQGRGGTASASPLLIHVSALVMLLLGAGDATARLFPALIGTAMVALPLVLRRELGRVGVVITMALLAFSPGLVHASRQDDASILAAGASFACVTFGLAAVRGHRGALHATAASAALLVLSGPLGWFAILGLTPFALFHLVSGQRGHTESPAQHDSPDPTRSDLGDERGPLMVGETQGAATQPLATPTNPASIRPAHVFLVVWLLVTTGLLTRMHGVQEGVADGLGSWLALYGESSGRHWTFYVWSLLGYELPTLVFGLAGAIYLSRFCSGSLLVRLSTWWALAEFVLGSLCSARPIGLTPQIVVPLALLAGAFAEELWPSRTESPFRRNLAWAALTTTILLVTLGLALSVVTFADSLTPRMIAWLALIALVWARALEVAVRTFGTTQTLRLAGTLGIAVSLLIACRASIRLSFRQEANPADLFVGVATSPDVRTLAAHVAEVGEALAINRRDRSVVVDSALHPLVSWFLRDLPGVSVGHGPRKPAIVVLPSDTRPRTGGYSGQLYQIARVIRQKQVGWGELWRWFVYRELRTPASPVTATVHVRCVNNS